MSSNQELAQLVSEISRGTLRRESSYLYDAVFLIALGYEKGDWPNIYGYIKSMGKLQLIYELGQRYGGSKPAQKAKAIKAEIEGLIDSCLRQIDEIMHQTKLKGKGKCKYI
jgi:hypothetical protein